MNIKYLTSLIFILTASGNSWCMNYIMSKFPDSFSNLIPSLDQSRYKVLQTSLCTHLTSRNIANASLYGAVGYVGYKGYKHTQKFNAGNREISTMLQTQDEKDVGIKTLLNELKPKIEENTNKINTLKQSRKEQAKSVNNLEKKTIALQAFFQDAMPEHLKNLPTRQANFSTLLDNILASSSLADQNIKKLNNKITKLKKKVKDNKITLEKIKNLTQQLNNESKLLNTTSQQISKSNEILDNTTKEIEECQKNLNNITDQNSEEHKRFISDVISELLKNKVTKETKKKSSHASKSINNHSPDTKKLAQKKNSEPTEEVD